MRAARRRGDRQRDAERDARDGQQHERRQRHHDHPRDDQRGEEHAARDREAHVQLERIALAQRRDRGRRRVEADRHERHHENAGREERAIVERRRAGAAFSKRACAAGSRCGAARERDLDDARRGLDRERAVEVVADRGRRALVVAEHDGHAIGRRAAAVEGRLHRVVCVRLSTICASQARLWSRRRGRRMRCPRCRATPSRRTRTASRSAGTPGTPASRTATSGCADSRAARCARESGTPVMGASVQRRSRSPGVLGASARCWMPCSPTMRCTFGCSVASPNTSTTCVADTRTPVTPGSARAACAARAHRLRRGNAGPRAPRAQRVLVALVAHAAVAYPHEIVDDGQLFLGVADHRDARARGRAAGRSRRPRNDGRGR